MRSLALALVHHPVVDRHGRVVTTAITSIDLHDVARCALAYGVSRVFATHPVAAQRELAARIRVHWVEGAGGRRIPDRKPAMELLEVVPSLDDATRAVAGDQQPEVWVTSARDADGAGLLGYDEGRAVLATAGPPVLICFGTGWGLAPEVMSRAARRLAPIEGAAGVAFNHLSVRAAVAITLDRLRSARGDPLRAPDGDAGPEA